MPAEADYLFFGYRAKNYQKGGRLFTTTCGAAKWDFAAPCNK